MQPYVSSGRRDGDRDFSSAPAPAHPSQRLSPAPTSDISMSSESGLKRRALTLLERHEICKKRLLPQHAYESLAKFAIHFPDAQGKVLSVSTLQKLLKESSRWLELNISKPGSGKNFLRSSQFPLLERHLVEWMDQANIARVCVTDDVIRVVSENLQERLKDRGEDYSEFTLSNGWISKFKARHNLRKKRYHGDGGLVDEELFPEMRVRIQGELAGYEEEDILNCDELALQYVSSSSLSCLMSHVGDRPNLTPEETITRFEILRGTKKDKMRITVFLITNATGSEKFRPWVIGRAARPLAFRAAKIDLHQLPVTYRNNMTARMTTEI